MTGEQHSKRPQSVRAPDTYSPPGWGRRGRRRVFSLAEDDTPRAKACSFDGGHGPRHTALGEAVMGLLRDGLAHPNEPLPVVFWFNEMANFIASRQLALQVTVLLNSVCDKPPTPAHVYERLLNQIDGKRLRVDPEVSAFVRMRVRVCAGLQYAEPDHEHPLPYRQKQRIGADITALVSFGYWYPPQQWGLCLDPSKDSARIETLTAYGAFDADQETKVEQANDQPQNKDKALSDSPNPIPRSKTKEKPP